MIVEVFTVNLPQEMKPFRMDERFIAFTDPKEPGEAMSFPEAQWAALQLGPEGRIGFISSDEPAHVKPDYSAPVPSYIRSKKAKG